MTDLRKTVLLMDDEIASADLLKQVISALEEAGFDVDTVDRMSEAMDAFYQRYYHVFILDIDMSFMNDVQDGSGADVARFLRALDSDTQVIFYSARGKIQDWFQAANLHLFGYIHKNATDSIGQLVQLAHEASTQEDTARLFPRPVQPPERALIVAPGVCERFPVEGVLALLEKNLSGWEVVVTRSLQEGVERIEEEPSSWGVVTILSERFSTRPSKMDQLSRLCRAAPSAQVIVACKGEEGAMPSILHIVNAHPFRLLDLLSPDIPERFELALADAVEHYGRREIFGADAEALQRLRLTFSKEVYDMYDDDILDDYDENILFEDEEVGE